MQKWPKDRNGNYFLTGCRVKDVYSDRYGTLAGYVTTTAYPKLLVQFEGEHSPTPKMPMMLEVISGGIQDGKR